MRAVLFKKFDDLPQDGILDRITKNNSPLRPIIYYGVFFEGLVSFHFARETDEDEYHRKGGAALKFFRGLSKHNVWNFESKDFILQGEMLNLAGYTEQATKFYIDAVKSAHDHKLLHEQAIASELAGAHLHDIS